MQCPLPINTSCALKSVPALGTEFERVFLVFWELIQWPFLLPEIQSYWKKTDFSLCLESQLQIASQLRLGPSVCFPWKCQNLIKLELIVIMCMIPPYLWVSMCTSPVRSGRHCFLGIFQSFCFSFCIAPWHPRGRFRDNILFRIEYFKVIHNCSVLSLCWFVYSKKKLL